MAEHSFVSAGRLRLVCLVRSFTLQLGAAAADRRPFPVLGRLGCPLAVQAAVLVDRWWLLPIVASLAWWFLPGDSLAELAAVVGAGLCGAMWAALGTGFLAVEPDPVVAVGAAWAALPLAVLGLGYWFRRRSGRRAGTA